MRQVKAMPLMKLVKLIIFIFKFIEWDQTLVSYLIRLIEALFSFHLIRQVFAPTNKCNLQMHYFSLPKNQFILHN